MPRLMLLAPLAMLLGGCRTPLVLGSRELPGQLAEDADVVVWCHAKGDPVTLYKCHLELYEGDIVWPYEVYLRAKRAKDKAEAEKGNPL